MVSVIIPTYNRAQKVVRAVESVLQQTYSLLEIIVVDDGSTDKTLAHLAKFGERVLVLSQSNRGPSAARNHGVAKATGEIVAFLDSDDHWLPGKIAAQVKLMTSIQPRVVCCVTNTEMIDKAGRAKTSFAASRVESQYAQGYWLNPSEIIATRFLQFNTVVAVWKSELEACGGFNEKMRILEDHDLAFRLSLRGHWGFISEPLVIKNDDIDGLSADAQKSRLKHSLYWLRSLEGLLQHNHIECTTTKRWLKTGLREAKTRVALFQKIETAGPLEKQLCELKLRYKRYWAAVRRRSPIWPKVEAFPDK